MATSATRKVVAEESYALRTRFYLVEAFFYVQKNRQLAGLDRITAHELT